MTKAEKTIEQVRANRALKGNGPLFRAHYVEITVPPAVKVEEILLKVDNLEKPWEKEDLLRRSITRCHNRILKLNPKSRVGQARIQEWLLAIDILQDKLNEMDQQGSMMERALTCTFHLLKGGRSKEIYRIHQQDVVISKGGANEPKKGVIKSIRIRKDKRPLRVVVVEGVRSFPAEKDSHGNVKAWVPGISVDARMEPRMLAVQGSCWKHHYTILRADGTKSLVPMKELGLVRFATHASPSVRLLGEAEMGREDEFIPIEDPAHGQVEIRRDASSNHVELPNDFDRAFNVVDEEGINRRYTYNPEREQEWLRSMLDAVENAKTPRELMWVMDEFIQTAWRAKAFRFNIYEQAHNACVLKGREKCPNHSIIGKWTTIGDADMQLPEATPEFEKWALLHPTSKKVKSLSAHWDNLLRREGLGAGFDGQPFSDTSEDALEIKEARAGDGSHESLDRMLSGDDDSDEDEASTKGGPVYTQAVDSVLTLEDIQKEKVDPAEAFSLACALFGRTRGASVDLIHKPKVSHEPWKSIPRPRMQTYSSPEDAITFAVMADLKGKNLIHHIVDLEHPDFAPEMVGFDSLDKALKALVGF